MTPAPLAEPGPYLEQLAAALSALGPSDDWVPLDAALRHLACLHPRLTGGLFGDPGVDADGLPAAGWMDEVVAEQALAREAAPGGSPPADPGRARAWSILAQGPVLPRARPGRSARSTAGPPRSRLWCDHRLPGRGWIRVSADIEGGDLEAAEHRILRHPLTAPAVLGAVLASTGCRVLRVCRAGVGPLWSGDGPAPPPWRTAGACLHLWREVWAPGGPAEDRDPVPPEHPGAPAWRERRFAVAPAAAEALEGWLRARGARCAVRSIGGG